MTEKAIPRRTITAAAWTIPVVAACSPVPAFAASGPACSPLWGKRASQVSDRWDFIVYPGCVADGKSRLPDTVHIAGELATLRTDSRGRVYYDLRHQRHSYTFRIRIVVAGVVTFDRVVDVRQSSLPA